MNEVTKIHETARLVSNILLERLQVEEQLLTMLVTNPSVTLRVKSEAFERITHINRKQLSILGASLK
jgi:hypothetical protein